MKTTLYIAIIFVCMVYNMLMQSMAFAAINLSLEYNIPVSVLIQANNNPTTALNMLSMKQLSEVTTS